MEPEDAEYARWLSEVQRRERQPGLMARGVSFWLSGLLVVIACPIVVGLLVLIARALR